MGAGEREGWQAVLASHGAQLRSCLAGFLARLAAVCARGATEHSSAACGGDRAGLSRGARRTVLKVLEDSRLDCLAATAVKPDCLGGPPDCLDSPAGHPQDYLALPARWTILRWWWQGWTAAAVIVDTSQTYL
jgi:hypothetical protein